MPVVLRRLALLAVTAVGGAVLAGPALAGPRPAPAALPNTVGSTNFLVHFQSDKVNAAGYAITQTTAGDIAAMAERALAAELADGYAAPLSDAGAGGDNRLDIYVDDLSGMGALAYTDSDNTAVSPTDAFIVLDGNSAEAMSITTIAHELFHAIQFAIWMPALPAHISDLWLFEATAEWMGFRVAGYPEDSLELGPTDMSLDCRDPNLTQMCDLVDDYKNNGYSRWPFFQFLAERYGMSFVKDAFAQGQAGAPTATTALANALAAKGTTLAAAYNAWIGVEMIGAYSIKALQGRKPTAYATIKTGIDPATFTQKVALNHLSTRYLKFVPGDDDASHICYSATLNLSVAMPAGMQSAPIFYWDAKGSTPVTLSVSGTTATAAIPWDTCTYTTQAGYLAVSNASLNLDAADLVVTATMTVDTTKPATPAPPPDPIEVNTPVVPVSGADVAPTLELFGPEVLRLNATDTQLRLIVESNGAGSVEAKIGSTTLGTVAIRGGNNDVRFKLPTSLLTSLRRSAAASNVLSLTPLSASGATAGKPVTRVVRIEPSAKAKAKPKAKPKPKRKLKRRR
jgi:Family of unknown function (DUF6055)